MSQTYDNFELVIINDGSTDSTLDVVKKFVDPRIKIYSFKNAGLSASRNRGIDIATGEYLSFIDADDLWSPDKLELQLKALEDNPSAAVAYSWSRKIDEQGEKLSSSQHLSFAGNILDEMICGNIMGGGSNMLARRDAVNDTGKFDEKLTSSEDWDYYIRLASKYGFAPVQKEQIFRRVTAGSMSSNYLNMEKTTLKVILKTFANLPRNKKRMKNITFVEMFEYLSNKASESGFSKKNFYHETRLKLKARLFYSKALKKGPTEFETYLKMRSKKRIRNRSIPRLVRQLVLVSLLPSKYVDIMFNKRRLDDRKQT